MADVALVVYANAAVAAAVTLGYRTIFNADDRRLSPTLTTGWSVRFLDAVLSVESGWRLVIPSRWMLTARACPEGIAAGAWGCEFGVRGPLPGWELDNANGGDFVRRTLHREVELARRLLLRSVAGLPSVPDCLRHAEEGFRFASALESSVRGCATALVCAVS